MRWKSESRAANSAFRFHSPRWLVPIRQIRCFKVTSRRIPSQEGNPKMSETARPEPQNADLAIQDKIFSLLMEAIKDPSLSDRQARYLSYILGRSGTKGATYRSKATIAKDLHRSSWTIGRIEASLISAGRLIVFSFAGREYRSPYPDLVHEFLKQHSPQHQPEDPKTSIEDPQEPREQNCSNEVSRTAQEPRPEEQPNPAPVAVDVAHEPDPIRPVQKNQIQEQPVLGRLIHNEQNQPHINPPVDNSGFFTKSFTTTKNPYHKNRLLVQHMTNDVCETLGIWKSWNWICKQLWSISETAEQHFIECCEWVREEISCNRCSNPFGLLRWRLREQGVIAST